MSDIERAMAQLRARGGGARPAPLRARGAAASVEPFVPPTGRRAGASHAVRSRIDEGRIAPADGAEAPSTTASGGATAERRAGAPGRALARTVARRSIELPLEALAEAGFLTPAVSRGRLREEFRRIKRPLLKSVDGAVHETVRGPGGAHPNIIAVTSSVMGEGKTFSAINLAMSLAMERGRTVLLIDADTYKGTASRTLGVGSDRPGLTDLLAGDAAPDEVIASTDVAALSFMPAGSAREETTELLSSPRMREIVDELAGRCPERLVVLDCPPVLQTNEANVIIEYAGQVVFVVAGEETSQALVLEAMRRFDEGQKVGILMNKARGGSAAYGYDYGYG